jgi:predicted acyl esterase
VPSQIVVEKNLLVAMRDGVHLATDVHRPDRGPRPLVRPSPEGDRQRRRRGRTRADDHDWPLPDTAFTPY